MTHDPQSTDRLTDFGRVRLVHDGIGITLWGGTEHIVSLAQAAALAALIVDVVDEQVNREAEIVEGDEFVPLGFDR